MPSDKEMAMAKMVMDALGVKDSLCPNMDGEYAVVSEELAARIGRAVAPLVQAAWNMKPHCRFPSTGCGRCASCKLRAALAGWREERDDNANNMSG